MAATRKLEEPLTQPQQPMTLKTHLTGINITASIRSGSNVFSFRSVPIGTSGRMLPLPVFPVIRVSIHFKAAVIVRIHEENESNTVNIVDIVVPVVVTLDGFNMTTIENETRILSMAVNKPFLHSNNFDGARYLNYRGDPITVSTTLSRVSGIDSFSFKSSSFAINYHLGFH